MDDEIIEIDEGDDKVEMEVWLEVNRLGDEVQTFKDKNITIDELLEFDEDELKYGNNIYFNCMRYVLLCVIIYIYAKI